MTAQDGLSEVHTLLLSWWLTLFVMMLSCRCPSCYITAHRKQCKRASQLQNEATDSDRNCVSLHPLSSQWVTGLPHHRMEHWSASGSDYQFEFWAHGAGSSMCLTTVSFWNCASFLLQRPRTLTDGHLIRSLGGQTEELDMPERTLWPDVTFSESVENRSLERNLL